MDGCIILYPDNDKNIMCHVCVYTILCPNDDENMWLCTLLCVRTMLRIPCGCVHNSVFGR